MYIHNHTQYGYINLSVKFIVAHAGKMPLLNRNINNEPMNILPRF